MGIIIEILVPELIIITFLALSFLRSFFKKLWALDGLVWLPVLALGIIIGIFPAYGFRSECIPMLIFTIVYNLANLPALISSVTSHPSESFREKRSLLSAVALVLLGVVAVPMLAFSPRVSEKPEDPSESVKLLEISNRTFGPTGFLNREYLLKIYGDVPAQTPPAQGQAAFASRANRPLIFIVPPEIGSVASIDLVCTDLHRKGFTVITYSYRDYDLVRKRSISSAGPLTHWRIFRDGDTLASANERGKALETQRREEVEFLLSQFPAVLGYTGSVSMPPILLVGYGAGGSALAYLAGENNFISKYNNVVGVVAVESRLWTAFLPEPRNVPVVMADGGIIRRQWANIVSGVKNLKPQQVIRTGSLPSAGIPVLYLVSGKVLDIPQGQKSYQAIVAHARSGSGPVALAALEGAGPLDYHDFPFTSPIYSFLLPGLKGAQKSKHPIGDTASIIGNFASLLLGQKEQAAKTNIPPRYAISGSLHIESRGLPGFRL